MNTLQTIKNESTELVTRAETLEINSPETVTEGTEMLSQINKYLDKIKKEKEKVLKPLRESANAEKARWKPYEDAVKPIMEELRKKLSAYQTAQIKKQREEEAKIAERMKPGKGNFKADTAIRKLENVERPEDKVETDSGKLGFREKKVLKITDEKKVPNKFWIIDEKALLDALKKGEKVPGAEIDIEMVPVNSR